MEKGRKALLVIDVQNDFCSGGALAVPGGDDVVKPINSAIKYAKENNWFIIASRDWHKTAHDGWPLHCIQNTKGAEFHSGLNISDVIIVIKGMGLGQSGYSAFEGITENGQPLEEFLHEKNISEIYITGLATDYCVKATAIDAVKKGFKKVVVVLDACRAVDAHDGMQAIADMQDIGVEFTKTTLKELW